MPYSYSVRPPFTRTRTCKVAKEAPLLTQLALALAPIKLIRVFLLYHDGSLKTRKVFVSVPGDNI